MKRFPWPGLLVAIVLLHTQSIWSAEDVVVVFNTRSVRSENLAREYARLREVPPEALIGLPLSKLESIFREEFQEKLQKPLWQILSERAFWKVSGETSPQDGEGSPSVQVRSAKVRYLVLSDEVPLRMRGLGTTSTWDHPWSKAYPASDSAVDSELAALPFGLNLPPGGPFPNPAFGADLAEGLHPTNGVLMVSRLDGPNEREIQKMLSRTLEAERTGLHGRGYFDARGLTDGAYLIGDRWILGASEVAAATGFDVEVERTESLFSAASIMSHPALYMGWYAANAEGPFIQPSFRFQPGAFAYHLHSFSAATLESETLHWVGPLLARGATATMGCVFEPYLNFTPNLTLFAHRWMVKGMTFGEAAYASQSAISWMTTVIGDPLYRPFARHPMEEYQALVDAGDEGWVWAALRVVNIQLAQGKTPLEAAQFLEGEAAASESPILLEKRAELWWKAQDPAKSERDFRAILAMEADESQKMRVHLSLAQMLKESGQGEEAYEVYQQFARLYPSYGDLARIFRLASEARQQR